MFITKMISLCSVERYENYFIIVDGNGGSFTGLLVGFEVALLAGGVFWCMRRILKGNLESL
jgi:hypothetical protein